MKITQAEWNKYIKTMSLLSDTASKEFAEWANINGGWKDIDRNLLAEAAYQIASKYADSSSALAGEMYEAIANAENKIVKPAELADEVDYGQLAKAINGALKHSTNDDFVSAPVGRAVKQAGADTMLKNASRDGAEFAWIPSGDSCPFCLVLASNGWRRASKKTTNGNHAEHIHTNCNCQFAIRFNKDTRIEGYDPKEYQKMYYDAEGNTPEEKINSIRAKYRAENRDKINAQKRVNYHENKRMINGIPKSWTLLGDVSEDEILKGVNPKFDFNLPKYLYGTKDDYTNNCTNCTVAYTQRKKGYNVTACSVGESGTLRNHNNLFTAWKGRTPIKSINDNFQEVYDYCSSLEDGAIVAIAYNVPQLPFIEIPGHAMVVEKRNNKVLFVDCQVNRTYNLDKIKDKEITDLAYMRVDDLELSDRGVSACKQVKN